MRILYVAKHDSGDNDDEGAVAYALQQLGHEVVRVQEQRRKRPGEATIDVELKGVGRGEYDFCLFHKWETVIEIAEVASRMPCVFWYFDLLSNDDDPTLAARMQVRRRWFEDVIPHCLTAFLTDGDWVSNWNSAQAEHGTLPQVHWLTQGADERYVGFGMPEKYPVTDILFTGTRHHGRKREEHVARLERRYGSRFSVIGETRHVPRRHGRELADTFASVKVVVAPDGPCTDRYWSNRVYLTLGLGGFLFHPYCKGLLAHYPPTALTYYSDRNHLEELIDACLDKPDHRLDMILRGYEATVERNLYRHRVEELVRVVRGLL